MSHQRAPYLPNFNNASYLPVSGTAVGSSFRTRYFDNVDPLPTPPRMESTPRNAKAQWRCYMESLNAGMSSMAVDKPLPEIPQDGQRNSRIDPQRPDRPSYMPPTSTTRLEMEGEGYYASSNSRHNPSPTPMHSYSRPPPPIDMATRPQTLVITEPSPSAGPSHTPQRNPPPISGVVAIPAPKTFKPSFHPLSTPPPKFMSPARPPILNHAHSAPTRKGKSRQDPIVIEDDSPGPPCTPRRRVKSAIDGSNATERGRAGIAASPSPSPASPSVGLRCAGITRQGLPCKRTVKSSAPWVDMATAVSRTADEGEHPRVRGRYCKDHAGQICGVKGFYWGATWVDFDDWIPRELGLQTRALLRMTMESALTPGESAGFIYAYELRDLATEDLSFYKVGRTDNVPRRIGQWTTQCSSHTPTLRDIFPLPRVDADREHGRYADSLPAAHQCSLLPGAANGGTSGGRMCGAVKRLERLIHLELADRSPIARLLDACSDCGTVHKEIFPLSRAQYGIRTYDDVVKEVVCRWERYVRTVCIGDV